MTAKLFETARQNSLGVVLVAHGLNNRAEVMDSLIAILQEAGFHCLRVALHDLSTPRERSGDEVERRWLDIMSDAYARIAQRFPDSPVFNLSYSLGALVTIQFLTLNPSTNIERMVLVAPPVALNWSASLIRLLIPFARLGWSLPSAAPKDVRIRAGTPLVEYEALLKMHDEVQLLTDAEVLNQIQTLVFLEEDDELVNRSGVLEWIASNQLTEWTARQLTDRNPEGRTYSHLMVVERALGQKAWHSLTEDIVSHFQPS